MKTTVDHSSEQTNTAPAHENASQGGGGSAEFADNRSGAIAQRKLRAGMADNPGSSSTVQLQSAMQSGAKRTTLQLQARPNHTGLPDTLKSGIENLSGYAMDDVKVHYNSSKPAQLRAHAYAQGTDIHVGPGQEKHLGHEAWHVVQQKQGRVKPTRQLKSKFNINDDVGLEREADVMGAKAWNQGGQVQLKASPGLQLGGNVAQLAANDSVIQCEFTDDAKGYIQELDFLIQKYEVNPATTADTKKVRLINFVGLVLEARSKLHDLLVWFVIKGERHKNDLEEEEEKIVFEAILKEFGYMELKELKEQLIKPVSHDNVDFKPEGVTEADFGEFINSGSALYKGMNAKYGDTKKEDADGFLKGVILSGAALPDEKDVPKGTVFYKLMPPGDSFVKSYSPFYLSKGELDKLLAGQKVGDILGLPVVNYSAVYSVFEIVANVDTTVFESEIAPTVQDIKEPPKSVRNIGGMKQTLILDSMNEGVWTKYAAPRYFLDPIESEIGDLAAYLSQEKV